MHGLFLGSIKSNYWCDFLSTLSFLQVPLGANGYAYFPFEELCDRPLGAADYFGLCSKRSSFVFEILSSCLFYLKLGMGTCLWFWMGRQNILCISIVWKPCWLGISSVLNLLFPLLLRGNVYIIIVSCHNLYCQCSTECGTSYLISFYMHCLNWPENLICVVPCIYTWFMMCFPSADKFHTLALDGVPIFGIHNRTAAYRFVTLVDVGSISLAFYEIYSWYLLLISLWFSRSSKSCHQFIFYVCVYCDDPLLWPQLTSNRERAVTCVVALDHRFTQPWPL